MGVPVPGLIKILVFCYIKSSVWSIILWADQPVRKYIQTGSILPDANCGTIAELLRRQGPQCTPPYVGGKKLANRFTGYLFCLTFGHGSKSCFLMIRLELLRWPLLGLLQELRSYCGVTAERAMKWDLGWVGLHRAHCEDCVDRHPTVCV